MNHKRDHTLRYQSVTSSAISPLRATALPSLCCMSNRVAMCVYIAG